MWDDTKVVADMSVAAIFAVMAFFYLFYWLQLYSALPILVGAAGALSGAMLLQNPRIAISFLVIFILWKWLQKADKIPLSTLGHFKNPLFFFFLGLCLSAAHVYAASLSEILVMGKIVLVLGILAQLCLVFDAKKV